MNSLPGLRTRECDDRIAALDSDLLRQVAHGDIDAFDQLYSKYFHRIYAYVVSKTANREDAEEVTGDVFVRIWRHSSSFRGDASVRTWLMTVANNAITDHYRRKSARKAGSMNDVLETPDLEQLAGSSPVSPEEASLTAEEYMELWSAMDELEPIHRDVIALRFVEELSYHEIAQRLQLPVGTVKSRIYRGVQALRSRLDAESSGRARS